MNVDERPNTLDDMIHAIIRVLYPCVCARTLTCTYINRGTTIGVSLDCHNRAVIQCHKNYVRYSVTTKRLSGSALTHVHKKCSSWMQNASSTSSVVKKKNMRLTITFRPNEREDTYYQGTIIVYTSSWHMIKWLLLLQRVCVCLLIQIPYHG